MISQYMEYNKEKLIQQLYNRKRDADEHELLRLFCIMDDE